MPILSAHQTAPAPTTTITATVRNTASADQTAAPASQELVVDTNAAGPPRVLSAHQVLEAPSQVVRIHTARLPAEPRGERQPAKPRLEEGSSPEPRL